MRGTLGVQYYLNGEKGLIPTYAGNTAYLLLDPVRLRAHPHVCGEHSFTWDEYPVLRGSSPRMRGTRVLLVECLQDAGLIPTYAGNTTDSMPLAAQARAHPHVCGEHGACDFFHGVLLGSSPRMRGTRETRSCCACPPGLIPTYAGNTAAAGYAA